MSMRFATGTDLKTTALCALIFALGGLSGSSEAIESAVTARDVWRFKVLFNGRDAGMQSFERARVGDRETVNIAADLDIKLFGFSVHKYRHRNVETWSQACLESMKTTTNDGGDPYAVHAVRTPEGLRVIAQGKEALLSGCVMSFAYWNPDFLKATRLLNSQTGEYQPVSIRPMGMEPLTVAGREVQANRYKLTAEGIDIDLWYADNREWVRLESDIKGSRLVYELTN